LENYVREILYGYPLLKTVGKDYEIHIRNKALLGSNTDGLRLAEYLAGEILQMDKLENLQGIVKEVLDKLTGEERILIEGRYFGKRRKLRDFLKRRVEGGQEVWSPRTYARRQQAAENKVCALLFCAGITQERYLRDYSTTDIFVKVRKRLEMKGAGTR
jgi:hypothetical protein